MKRYKVQRADAHGDCKCSILNAREEKLLDDQTDSIQVRLICNQCGSILDEETIPQRSSERPAAERETAEGAA